MSLIIWLLVTLRMIIQWQVLEGLWAFHPKPLTIQIVCWSLSMLGQTQSILVHEINIDELYHLMVNEQSQFQATVGPWKWQATWSPLFQELQEYLWKACTYWSLATGYVLSFVWTGLTLSCSLHEFNCHILELFKQHMAAESAVLCIWLSLRGLWMDGPQVHLHSFLQVESKCLGHLWTGPVFH